MNKEIFKGYKKVLAFNHGDQVIFKISYNPKPKSKSDYFKLEVKPWKGDECRFLMCQTDVAALIALFGLALHKHNFDKDKIKK